MTIAKKTLQVFGAALVVLSSAWSCGRASNNDQGAAFTNEAYWVYDQQGDTWKMSTGSTMEINLDDPELHASPRQAWIGMRLGNKLVNQFINVKRVDCSYEIPGADPALQIPNDSAGVSIYLPHAAYTDPKVEVHPDDQDASGGTVVASTQHAYFPIVSANLIQFFNVSRNSLPELPFSLLATCSAIGVTEAGDTLETNKANYLIEFYETYECCAPGGAANTEGFHNGAGTGGDYTSYDPNASITSSSSTSSSSSSSTGGA